MIIVKSIDPENRPYYGKWIVALALTIAAIVPAILQSWVTLAVVAAIAIAGFGIYLIVGRD